MRILRFAFPFAVLVLTVFSLSCNSGSQSVTGLEDHDFLAKPIHCYFDDSTGPGCGGGSPDGPATFNLAMTGGMELEAAGIELIEDSKKRVKAPFTGAKWNMVLTHAAAQQELTNPNAADICIFDPPDMDDELKQPLVDMLMAADAYGSIIVHKRDMRGGITAGPNGAWVALGNDPDAVGQDDPRFFVDDNGSGVDWNDARVTREFRIWGGTFRTFNEDGKLKCSNQDEIVATLAPAD